MARAPADAAIYAVGDIHGRLDLLTRMHELIAADASRRAASRRLLVYLGDYGSRGPGGALTYTLPPGAVGGKLFARLLVTPN